jgi:hypothetical protein
VEKILHISPVPIYVILLNSLSQNAKNFIEAPAEATWSYGEDTVLMIKGKLNPSIIRIVMH